MANLLIEDVELGMILGEDIYNKFEVMVVAGGSIITKAVYDTLERLNIDIVSIVEKEVDGVSEIVVIEEPIQEIFNDTVISFKKIFNDVRFGKQILADDIKETLGPMIDQVMTNPALTKRLFQLETCDQYTYDHSVTVSLASALLGKWMGLSEESINELALAGLMHDIGKCNIPNDILNKPDRLTEDEFNVMKTHSTLGYILLRSGKGFSNDILDGVYQHHEKYSGKGYPNSIKGDKIHLYGRLIAVADVYSAMTSTRVYREKMSPFQVAKLITEYSFDSLDPSIVKVFLSNISNYYVGTLVKLSDGRIGQVVLINKHDPARPLVKIEGEYLDLSKDYSVEIKALID